MQMHMTDVMFLTLLLLATILFLVLHRYAEKRRQRRLADRTAVPVEQSFADFLPTEDAELRIRCRTIIDTIADALEVNATALHPDDSIRSSLALGSPLLLDETVDLLEESLSDALGEKVELPESCNSIAEILMHLGIPRMPRQRA